MSNQRRVYTKVLKTLKQLMPTQTQGHVVTLAMMVTGIVLGKKAQLTAMSTQVPHLAKDSSIEMRMRRWVKNERIEIEAYFMPFARELLAGLTETTLVLAMDGSTLGRGCMVLMVGVVYHKRALPLAWVVYKGKKGHAPAETHVAALEAVLPLIPHGADVVLLGDGEYDSVEMLAWVDTQTDWHVVARTASDTQVYSDGEWVSLHELCVPPGGLISLPEVRFTRQAFGPLHVIAWWDKDYDDPLYLVTNLELAEEACHFYKRRYRIETLFSDKKSRGFHINKSHLSEPTRLARLLIASSLAYIWMIYLGLSVIQAGCTDLIDRVDRTDKSLFRLGLDWLHHLLKWEKPFSVQFFVPPYSPLANLESVR
jgi:hypothetical protein